MNTKSKSKGAASSPMIREAYVVGFTKNAELGAVTLSVVAINVGSRPVHKYELFQMDGSEIAGITRKQPELADQATDNEFP